MDALMQNYIDIEKKNLLYDYRHRGAHQTWINRAYAMMLTEQGLLDRADYQKIDRGLVQVQENLTEQELMAAPHGQDIYFASEQALYRCIGMETACKLHVGRSRNDLYYTQYRMSLREAVWQISEEILETQKLLEEKAAEHFDTIIPYYTYGQPAQPGTWGHYLMSIHLCLEGDLGRLQRAYGCINRCPMGAAAGIGSAFPLNKERMAELLGFDGAIENTLMANSAVDYYLELESAMAILSTTLERVGSDLDFFATMECGILEGDKEISSGSSIMPQKKNYGPGALLRCRALSIYSSLQNAMTAAGSVTMFPVHETYSYFEDFWRNADDLIGSLRLLKLALEHSRIRADAALARARDGFTAATHMAEQLTMEIGEPFVKTHHIVGGMIHRLMDEDRLAVENMTGELMREESVKAVGFPVERTDAQIAEMLDPLASLKAKVTGGTPRPEDTRLLLETGQKKREENERWLAAARKKAEDAYRQVERGI